MPSWKDQQSKDRKEEEAYQKREREIAAFTMKHFDPPDKEDSIVLGAVLDKRHKKGIEYGGDISSDGRWFSLYVTKPRHTIVEGMSGCGKTELLKSMIQQYMSMGKRIVIVDGAGNQSFAKSVCIMADEAGCGPVPVLRYPRSLGKTAVFDGFSGSNDSIYNRLIAMLDVEDLHTDGDHYRDMKRDLLTFVCGVNTQKAYPGSVPIEPPKSFQDLSDRLTDTWLEKNFGNSPKAMEKINAYKHKGELIDLQRKVDSRILPLLHLLDSDGFKLGQSPVTVFSIDRPDGGTIAEYLFRFLSECFKEAMGRSVSDTVWFIDEFGLFGSEGVSTLVKYARNRGLTLVLSLQVVESIEEDRFIKEILGNTAVKILMRGDDPVEMVRRAGTYIQSDTSYSVGSDGMSKGVTVRDKEVYKIDPNEAKALLDGEAFVRINGGVVKVQGQQVKLKKEFQESMEDRTVREDILDLLRAEKKASSSEESEQQSNTARKTRTEKDLFP